MSPGVARVAIAGGGPIGLACALLLARRGIPSIVVEARPRPVSSGETPGAAGGRLIALARGTLDVLASLSVHGLPYAPIREVRVSSAGELGAVRLRSADFGDDRPLGACVYYEPLVAALVRRVEAEPQITLLQPRRVARIVGRPDRIELELDDGDRIQGDVAVDAEGSLAQGAAERPDATRPAPDRIRSRDAGCALAGEVIVDGLDDGVAVERFTREGPLALLPLPGGSGGMDSRGGRRSVVWCMDDAEASRRITLAPDRLVDELNRALGSRHGIARRIDACNRVPLKHGWRRELRAHRIAFVGNAAQSLHPVAGQGFNLGVRDAVTLVDCLSNPARLVGSGGPYDPIAALSRYAARRRVDRALIASITGHLPGLFATRHRAIAVARSTGLLLLGAAAPLRRQLGYLLMFGVRSG